MLTYAEAIAKLNDPANASVYSTKAGLMSLVEQISVQDPVALPGARTITYSGMLGNGIDAGKLANAIADSEGGNVRIIDRTEAGKFLEDTDFKNAARQAILNESPKLATDPVGLKAAIGDFIYNTDPALGPWANRSVPYIQAAEGGITNITPNAVSTPNWEGKAGRTWGLSELNLALENTKVPDISGISRQQLFELFELKCSLEVNGYSPEAALKTIQAMVDMQSRANIAKVAVDLNAAGEIVSLDPKTLPLQLSRTGSTTVAPDAVSRSTVGEKLSPMSLEQEVVFRNAGFLADNLKYAKYWNAVDSAGKALGTVGNVFILGTAYVAAGCTGVTGNLTTQV